MVMGSLLYRRYHMFINQWQMGMGTSTYTYVGVDSEVEANWQENYLEVKFDIPGKSGPPVFQNLGNYYVSGELRTRDLEAFSSLLYAVPSATGTVAAIGTVSRNAVLYFKLREIHDKITNSTDANDFSKTYSVQFSNTVFQTPKKQLAGEGEPWSVTFRADSVSETWS